MSTTTQMLFATIACLVAIVSTAPLLDIPTVIKTAVVINDNNDTAPVLPTVKKAKGTKNDKPFKIDPSIDEEEFDSNKPLRRFHRVDVSLQILIKLLNVLLQYESFERSILVNGPQRGFF